jgi:hypothetical protein
MKIQVQKEFGQSIDLNIFGSIVLFNFQKYFLSYNPWADFLKSNKNGFGTFVKFGILDKISKFSKKNREYMTDKQVVFWRLKIGSNLREWQPII